jgi:flagellar hook-associated protein 1
MGFFGGINTGLRSLVAHQMAIDVTNQNVANANTEGYSRQSVRLTTVSSSGALGFGSTDTLMLSRGVDVSTIERYHSNLVDAQLRQEMRSSARWNTMSESLGQIEAIFNEPSDEALSTAMSRFFNSWQDLSANPTEDAARLEVRGAGEALSAQIQRTYVQLTRYQADTDGKIPTMVDQINGMTKDIVDLNNRIVQLKNAGESPNDLTDKRDLLLDKLAQMTGATSVQMRSGAVNVFLGNQVLIAGTNGESRDILQATYDSTTHLHKLTFQSLSGANPLAPGVPAADITQGELGGLLEVRGPVIQKQLDALNTLASNLVSEVNAQHRLGYRADGLNGTAAWPTDFFAPTAVGVSAAASIRLSDAVQLDDHAIALASALDPDNPGFAFAGDGGNALLISQMATRSIAALNGTFSDFYGRTTSALGLDSKQATTMATSEQALVDNLTMHRESLSGVSLDEEAANLVKYQRVYQASLRVLNVYDDMLDRIVNGLGLSGR